MTKTVSLDHELAARAEELFAEIGLDLPTALRLFLLQSLRDRGLPFTPRLGPARERTENAAPSEPLTAEPCSRPAPAASSEPDTARTEPAAAPAPADEPPSQNPPEAEEEDAPSGYHAAEVMETFRKVGLIGSQLRRIRTLNRIYSVGDPNPQVPGWRAVLIAGDEPLALDFGAVRVELGYQGGGSLRMMDGRLPDEVLESDAVCPRDMSPVFSSIIGRSLTAVTSSADADGTERLHLHFAGGSVLNFMAGAEWCRLWLTDARGTLLYAPESVWVRTLGRSI